MSHASCKMILKGTEALLTARKFAVASQDFREESRPRKLVLIETQDLKYLRRCLNSSFLALIASQFLAFWQLSVVVKIMAKTQANELNS